MLVKGLYGFLDKEENLLPLKVIRRKKNPNNNNNNGEKNPFIFSRESNCITSTHHDKKEASLAFITLAGLSGKSLFFIIPAKVNYYFQLTPSRGRKYRCML